MDGEECCLRYGVSDGNEFYGNVFVDVSFFSGFDNDNIVRYALFVVFESECDEFFDVGSAEDGCVVFFCKVGYGADVVEVTVGECYGANVVFPVVNYCIVGDGVCLLEFFGCVCSCGLFFFSVLDEVVEVVAHVDENDVVACFYGGHVFADFAVAADCA